MEFAGKNILVCGMARSGISAALLLKSQNAAVVAQDLKPREALYGAADELEKNGITVVTGIDPSALSDKTDMIILSPGVPTDAPFLMTAAQKNIPVLSELELGFLFCAAPVIAITGTNGKTTTTALTGEIIKKKYRAKILGNIGTAFTSEAINLTPDDAAVLEVSSFQLEHVNQFKPKVAVVLNITPDHLDRHKTIENYIAIKERVFKNQTSGDFLILNYDDPVCRGMAGKAASQTIFFSRARTLRRGVFIDGGSVVSNVDGEYVEIMKTDEIQIPGDHILEDILASCAAACCMGVPAGAIADAVRAFRGVAHRLEHVAVFNGVDYFNDSKATNPDAAIKGLAAMKRPVVLICGGYDKHIGFHDWTARFNEKVRLAVLMGATAEKIAAACEINNFHNYRTARSLKEAVEICAITARPGDAVLLSPACASWDMFRDFEERGQLFCEYARALTEIPQHETGNTCNR